MANDPGVVWQQADALAIQVSEREDQWNAGHVNDIAVLDDGSLIAAAQTGGLWMVSPSGTGIALGDFDSPDFNSIALGPDGPRHFFAAGGSLFETDASAPLPLLTWKKITPLQDETTAMIGGIYKVAVIDYMRIVVLACTNGVFWSSIPQTTWWRRANRSLRRWSSPPPMTRCTSAETSENRGSRRRRGFRHGPTVATFALWRHPAASGCCT